MKSVEEMKKLKEKSVTGGLNYIPQEVDYRSTPKLGGNGYAPQHVHYDSVPKPSQAIGIKAKPVSKAFDLPEEQFELPIDPYVGVNRLPRGSIKFGQYLKKGYYGEVYQGEWGKRLVALKKIYDQGVLEWEVLRLSTASHHNLVQFYGIYQEGGETYLVMELCKGDLESRLRKNLKLDWSIRWQWALEMTQGLAYLHHEGMVHRDLKADNILLDHDDRARLADLGVAQVDALLQQKEARAVAKGEQAQLFIAPEVLTKYSLGTTATDIYTLGLVFWQLVSGGKDPRSPKDGNQLLTWMQSGEREPIPTDCPAEFRKLILDCWQLDPSKRPSADQIISRLHTLGPKFHAGSHWIKFCEAIDSEIHPIRAKSIQYIAPFVTQHRIEEDLDAYWQRIEAAVDGKEQEQKKTEEEQKIRSEQFGNPPLDLDQILVQFLRSSGSGTLVLLGEAGLGKTLSVYQLADRLLSEWWGYINNPNKGIVPYLPIFVRPTLNRWSHSELKSGLEKAFRHYGLEMPLTAIKSIRCLVIVDGYDECEVDREPRNLAEELGLQGYSDIKLLVTARSNTVPVSSLQQRFVLNGHLAVRYFLPFNLTQMLNYLKDGLCWDKTTYTQYQQKFQTAPALRAVLRNPFVLSLLVQSWETVSKKDFNQLNRWQIYQSFVEHWIITHHSLLSPTLQKTLIGTHKNVVNPQQLLESFNAFAAEVAFTAFNQGSIALDKTGVAKLSTSADCWINLKDHLILDSKQNFLARQEALMKSGDNHRAILSESDFITLMLRHCHQFQAGSPLKNKAILYEFSHKSFFEYFAAKGIVQLKVKDSKSIIEEGLQLLNHRAIQSEPEILRFMAEAWREPDTRLLINPFNQMIEHSKHAPNIAQASANAATLLNVGRVSFAMKKWDGIRIPGAKLNNGVLDGIQLRGADLSGVDLESAWLHGADFEGTLMPKVNFGELAYEPLKSMECVKRCYSYSSDGRFLAIMEWAYTYENAFYLYDTITRTWLHNFRCKWGNQALAMIPGQTAAIAISPDGQTLALGIYCRVELWDIASKRLLHVLEGHLGYVGAIAFSPNGSQLASGAEAENTVRVWNTRSGTLLQTFEGHSDRITCLAFSHNGKILASGSYDKTVKLWCLEKWVLQGTLEEFVSSTSCIVFSPDSQLLASEDNRTIRLFNVKTRACQKTFEEHANIVTCIKFSDNGEQLVSSFDSSVRLWDIGSGMLIKAVEADDKVEGLAFCLDKEHVTFFTKSILRYWKIANIPYQRTFTGHSARVTSVSCSSDGQFLVSGSEDGTIKSWDIVDGFCKKTSKRHDSSVERAIFSPNGSRLATLVSKSHVSFINIWDFAKGILLRTIVEKRSPVQCIAFSVNGDILAAGSYDTLRLWNVETGVQEDFKGYPENYKNGVMDSWLVNCVSFNPNGLQLASGCIKDGLRLWDIKSGAHKALGMKCVGSIDYSPNGQLLAATECDSDIKLAVKIWETAKGICRKTFKTSKIVNSIAFSPDGTFLAYASDDNLCLLDVEGEDNIFSVAIGSKINSLCWTKTPQGTFLVTGGDDKFIRCWELENFENRRFLKLQWVNEGALHVTGANFNRVIGLSTDNISLLKQLGALGEPVKLDKESAEQRSITDLSTEPLIFSAGPSGIHSMNTEQVDSSQHDQEMTSQNNEGSIGRKKSFGCCTIS